MPPHQEYDPESDSDSDAGSVESSTDVLLGLSDGPVEGDDGSNPLVSRIGGSPAWLPARARPPVSVATCELCSRAMELLVQIFAPLDGSAYDRVLYVWGCARGACQRQPKPSVRAVRLLQFNARWAAKLAKRQAREEAAAERRKAREAAKKARAEQDEKARQTNPFSAAASLSGTNAPGGLGDALFGAPATAKPAVLKSDATAPADDVGAESADETFDSDSEDDEGSRLAEELAVKASLDELPRENDWASTSSHYNPPLYLNTIPEPSASARSAALLKMTPGAKAALESGKETVPNGDDKEIQEWEGETYSRMEVNGVDEAFERFVARVSPEGRQVVRYEKGGIPIPFAAAGSAYDKLWPRAKSKIGADRSVAAAARPFNPSSVPPCEACGGARDFELQLMPNLINLLRPENVVDSASATSDGEAKAAQKLTVDQARRRDIEQALGRKLQLPPDADGITRTAPQLSDAELEAEKLAMQARTGLGFATAFIFTCQKDCCLPRSDEAAAQEETWREEWVAMQWEQ
ncbi:hypothetical protein IE81DRAFT_322069 [Ceraceosorus guamensis]|uniref:Programmed cell death protein 2 C-terminal domain-containing protein n=1 Tax=Ceraceosorus guamensis TaxID=1522189 RepID=A0A316W1L1_9BASI|nr:hypothetical protein IE81DRAFT_322069 [Ceraceosorus guamensis]PWN43670.1 hypothetical protein IE81DRAFT_322069 [Ceraceosorus guamensis]